MHTESRPSVLALVCAAQASCAFWVLAACLAGTGPQPSRATVSVNTTKPPEPQCLCTRPALTLLPTSRPASGLAVCLASMRPQTIAPQPLSKTVSHLAASTESSPDPGSMPGKHGLPVCVLPLAHKGDLCSQHPGQQVVPHRRALLELLFVAPHQEAAPDPSLGTGHGHSGAVGALQAPAGDLQRGRVPQLGSRPAQGFPMVWAPLVLKRGMAGFQP